MIVAGRSGNIEIRATTGEWGTEAVIPRPGMDWLSGAGVTVSRHQVYGLPAVSNVVRSPSELVASLPFLVYHDDPGRERAMDSWQWQLLHEQPSELADAFQFFFDLNLSLEVAQNAFIQKAQAPGVIVALYVLDPQRVRVYADPDTGDKLFDVYVSPTETRKGLTTDDILHVRGFAPAPGAFAGVSLIEVHRDPLGAMLAMQQFEGDYFRNHAVPPAFFTGAANKQHAQDLIDLHNANHKGSGNQWKVGALWGQVDVKPMPISLNDALFVETKRLSQADACRIWRWPAWMVDIATETHHNPDRSTEMLKFNLLPRLRRIERAFAADPIFVGTDLVGEFLTAAMERADIKTRYAAYLQARQAGWLTPNEIRDKENEPPIEGGDELQQTPVGGAPNMNGQNGNAAHSLAELIGSQS